MDRLKISSFIKRDRVSFIYKSIFTLMLVMGVSGFRIGDFSLFYVSIALVLSTLGVNLYVAIFSAVLSAIVSSMNVSGVIFSFLIVLSLVLYDTLKDYSIFRKYNILPYIIFSLLSIGYFAIHFTLDSSLPYLILCTIFNILFFYISNNFFSAVATRGLNADTNIDEKISGAVVLVIFIIGICNYSKVSVDFAVGVATFILLISTYVFSTSFTIVIGVLIGLGYAIAYVSPVYISLYVMLGLVSSAFKTNYKIFSIISVVITHTVFSTYFIDYYVFSIPSFISMICACILFQFVPLIVFESMVDIICRRSTPTILIDIVNRTKSSISNRLREISQVFDRMDYAFRKMVRGKLQDDVAIAMVKDDIYKSMCANCESRDSCVHIPSEICDDVLSDIVRSAFEKGKISVLDIPQRLSNICNVTALTNLVNRVIQDFKGYYNVVKNMDSSRLLVATQLGGVSKLLTSLSNEVSTNISFDVDRERQILEELSYNNIIGHECVVYEKDPSTLIVNLVISKNHTSRKALERVVSKCTSSKMHITSIEQGKVRDMCFVTLATRPHYDIVYGSASVTKGGDIVSGDNYSVTKIDDSKYMVALCDGMGSGRDAHSISSLTLSLIENYYRAGFTDDVIISSINKLLMLNELESYSTVDLCVFDLRKNNYSFVKLGATTSFIKGASTTEEITGSGLPIGILEDIRPHIILRKIRDFDSVILCSDGVIDSFVKTDIVKYINSLDIINPSTLADTILQKAISNYGGIHKDDMTVVVVRVFPT